MPLDDYTLQLSEKYPFMKILPLKNRINPERLDISQVGHFKYVPVVPKKLCVYRFKSVDALHKFEDICKWRDMTEASQGDFVNTVILRCKRLGWKDSQLSEKAGISKSVWSNIKNRTKNPTLKTIEKICNACGLKIKFISKIQ